MLLDVVPKSGSPWEPGGWGVRALATATIGAIVFSALVCAALWWWSGRKQRGGT